jgi:hypothetical protein
MVVFLKKTFLFFQSHIKTQSKVMSMIFRKGKHKFFCTGNTPPPPKKKKVCFHPHPTYTILEYIFIYAPAFGEGGLYCCIKQLTKNNPTRLMPLPTGTKTYFLWFTTICLILLHFGVRICAFWVRLCVHIILSKNINITSCIFRV